MEVTDIPTGEHAVYESTESDKFAPLSLGASAALQIGSTIRVGTQLAVKKLEEDREKATTSTKSTDPEPEKLSFRDRVASFQHPKDDDKGVRSTPRTSTKSIGSAMKGVLDQPATWIQEGRQTLIRNSGRCFSFAAAVVASIGGKTKHRIEVFGSSEFDHYFVVVGRPDTATTSVSTWGGGTVVIDAWHATLQRHKSACYAPGSYQYNSGLKLICRIQ